MFAAVASGDAAGLAAFIDASGVATAKSARDEDGYVCSCLFVDVWVVGGQRCRCRGVGGG